MKASRRKSIMRWVSTATVLAVALAGCSSSDDAAAEDLVGTWVSSDGPTWEVTDDSISVVREGRGGR